MAEPRFRARLLESTATSAWHSRRVVAQRADGELFVSSAWELSDWKWRKPNG